MQQFLNGTYKARFNLKIRISESYKAFNYTGFGGIAPQFRGDKIISIVRCVQLPSLIRSLKIMKLQIKVLFAKEGLLILPLSVLVSAV